MAKLIMTAARAAGDAQPPSELACRSRPRAAATAADSLLDRDLQSFSSLGFVFDVLAGGRQPAPQVALNVLVCGLLAVGYALLGLPKQRWAYAALIGAQLAYVFLVPGFFTPLAAMPRERLVI